MSNSIKPTIGRKVWLWVGNEGFAILDPKQAFDATVVFVHPDGKVNLSFSDHEANGPLMAEFVTLRDPQIDDQHGTPGMIATWMPYQVTQAQKTFSEAKKEEADK